MRSVSVTLSSENVTAGWEKARSGRNISFNVLGKEM
jgi:hypothetical protein